MYFCPFCSSLLFTEHNQSLFLSCSSCPYTYKITDELENVEFNQVKKIERILGGEDELKYANKCEAKCPKCSHNQAMFLELQTRSADEPSTIFYQCVKCRFDWKE